MDESDEGLTRLARLAMALVGDRESATQLAGSALARTRPDASYTGIRQQLLRRFLADSPRSGLARAAVVLTGYEHLTTAEAAAILDRSPTAFHRALLDAADSGPVRTPETADLEQLAAAAPEPAAVRQAAVDQRRKLRRHRRRRTALVAAASGLALLLLALPSVWPRLFPPDAVYIRPRGTWVQGFEVRPPPGWVIERRSITSEGEQVDLADQERRLSCWVYLGVALEAGPTRVPTGRQVRVQGRVAVWLADTAGLGPYLWWDYAPGAQATLGCSNGGLGVAEVEALAEDMTFAPQRILVPFDLSGLASSYRVQSLGLPAGLTSVDLVPRTTGDTAGGFSVVAGGDQAGPVLAVVDSPRFGPVSVLVDGGTVRICLPGPRVCLSTDAGRAPSDSQRIRLAERLVANASRIEFSPDYADRSTWFDAEGALPG